VTPPLPPAPAFGQPMPIAAHPEVLRFLALRRSASALTLQAPGPDAAQLDDLIRLAARAPDHGKLSPWRFIILEGDAKSAFADRLEAIARAGGDPSAIAKLGKLRTPPLAIVVVSAPRQAAIPQWEQTLSAGVVCANLLYAALAMGFGANWITDWYSYDLQALQALGVASDEKVAGFVLVGASKEPPLERERPLPANLLTRWRP